MRVRPYSEALCKRQSSPSPLPRHSPWAPLALQTILQGQGIDPLLEGKYQLGGDYTLDGMTESIAYKANKPKSLHERGKGVLGISSSLYGRRRCCIVSPH